MTTRYCSKCGRAYDLDEHPAYCSGCGESLEGLEKKGKADSGRKGPANPFYLDPEETDPAYWQVKEEIASESDTEIPEAVSYTHLII